MSNIIIAAVGAKRKASAAAAAADDDNEYPCIMRRVRPTDSLVNLNPIHGAQVVHMRVVHPGAGGDERFVTDVKIGDGASLFHFQLTDAELGTLQQDMCCERPDEYEEFSFMGKRVKHPRKHRAYLRSYFFSGKRHTAVSQQDTPLSLLRVMQLIEAVCRVSHHEMRTATFNSALVNWYANGHEYIAKHADDERDLVASPTVATLSLGQERVLRIRRKSGAAPILRDVKLKHGSVYIMHGARFQKDYTHEVPKVGGKKGEEMGERISVTLRQHADQ